MKYYDLTGQVFGRLTAIMDYDRDTDGSALWKCRCTCGNITLVRACNLINGTTKSCGCYRRELSRKFNAYEIDGDLVHISDSKGNKALIDLAFLDKIKPSYWFKTRNGYFATVTLHKHQPRLLLHRFIYGEVPKGYDIDHINRDKTDNRLCNLRLATRAQNNINKYPNRANTTGYVGVCAFNETKYRAYITVDGKQKHLGVFYTKEEAYEARLEAERKYYKDFSTKLGVMNK